MADVKAALGALDRIEGILRKRYHYPHPIFEHVAAARAALEEPVKVEASATAVADTEDATPEPESGTEGPIETPSPKPRRKRGNR